MYHDVSSSSQSYQTPQGEQLQIQTIITMSAPKSNVRVAVTQHEPVWLDLEGTVKKTIAIIEEAAKGGAQLVVWNLPHYLLRRLLNVVKRVM